MSCLQSSRLACLVVLLGVCFAPGCGNKVSLTPVSGKVTVDGTPITAGQVSLIPDVLNPNDERAKGQTVAPTAGLSSGTINSDGTYKIFTAGKEGAPLGKYKVNVTPSMMPSGDPKAAPASGFNRKFSDPQNSPLRIEVTASPAAGAYDLKLTK